MHYKHSLLILLTFFSFIGCEYKTDDPIPGYVTINNIMLDHERNTLGITDAWVYVNNNILGVYELPAHFPVVAEGTTKITVIPGVKVNGISDTRTFYPFYEPYNIDINFEAAKEYNLKDVRSRYYDWATKLMVDDFEGQSPYFKNDYSSDTSMYNIKMEDAVEGSKSGVIHLDTLVNVRYFEAATIDKFIIPDFNDYSGMYLEMNFRCDNAVEIGLIVEESGVTKAQLISLFPTNKWKKIYIDLYNPLITYNEGSKFKVYISAGIDKDKATATIYLDDMKIVH